MPARIASTPYRRAAALAIALLVAACADLGPVRDFGRSAAAVAAYPKAATAYVDSARASAAFVAGGESMVSPAQRLVQVKDALALHAAVGDYFATLARLAGDDEFTLAAMKSTATEVRQIGSGSFDRSTVDAYAKLGQTLARFADAPARERAVRELVQEGGPHAMALLEALRQVAGLWREQVANDARQVDDTIAVGVLPADVPPLLRVLANDRRAQLRRQFAQTLAQMTAADTALASVEKAHAELASRLDDLSAPDVRTKLRRAATDLWSAAVRQGGPVPEEPTP